jgi:predicted HTH domain antitoxin
MNNLMTVEYPDSLPDVLHMSRGEFEREARLAMAVKLFENGKLTSGQAARLAGLHKAQFLAELSRFGVASIQIEADELEQDLAVAQAAHESWTTLPAAGSPIVRASR